MPQRHPMKYRELLERLSKFGVVEMPKRGKGSERILLRPIASGSKRGPSYPLKHHGQGTEIYLPVINAILRRLNIPEDAFWS